MDRRVSIAARRAFAKSPKLRSGLRMMLSIFLQHRVAPNVPLKTAGAVEELIAEARSSTWPVGSWSQTIRRAHAVQPVTALQANIRFGIAPREEIIPVLEELGIGFVPFSPLGKGFLTGKMDDSRPSRRATSAASSRAFAPEAMKANQALIDLLAKIAEQKKATTAQIAWLAAGAEAVDCAIPGTTKLHRLEENIGAAALELTADDLSEIETAAGQIKVEGARYPEHIEKMTGR